MRSLFSFGIDTDNDDAYVNTHTKQLNGNGLFILAEIPGLWVVYYSMKGEEIGHMTDT